MKRVSSVITGPLEMAVSDQCIVIKDRVSVRHFKNVSPPRMERSVALCPCNLVTYKLAHKFSPRLVLLIRQSAWTVTMIL